MGKHSGEPSLAERMYQESQKGQHQKLTDSLEVPSFSQEDSASTEDDFSVDRPMMLRIRHVFDHILNIMPDAAKKDMRYKFVSQLMRDGLKDLALIPDRVIAPLMKECGMALLFMAEGDMEQLQERLADLEAERDIPDDAGD